MRVWSYCCFGRVSAELKKFNILQINYTNLTNLQGGSDNSETNFFFFCPLYWRLLLQDQTSFCERVSNIPWKSRIFDEYFRKILIERFWLEFFSFHF